MSSGLTFFMCVHGYIYKYMYLYRCVYYICVSMCTYRIDPKIPKLFIATKN